MLQGASDFHEMIILKLLQIIGSVSEDFDDDYDGFRFTIEKNDILAVDDGFTNKIEFDEDEDNKKSSIFLIVKDLSIKDETMRVEFDTNKITIST